MNNSNIPPSITTTITPPHTLNYSNFRNGYKDYNKRILLNSKTLEWKEKNKHEWAHKQLCVQHELYPNLIQKHFTNNEMPCDLFKICQCGKLKNKVKNKYIPILRLSLDKALEPSNWKMKSAYFTDINIQINDNIHNKITKTIQMIKIKIGAVKRYTQPKTEKDIFGTASFYKKTVFWHINNMYILEMRLKSRECKQKVNVDINKTAKDVAAWWYQCWGLHGIREEKDHSLHQFFAIHDNTFVHKTSLHHNLQRVSLWLHKNKEDTSANINANINGIPMINIQKIKRNLSQNSSQAQPRSQTPSQPSQSQSQTPSPKHKNNTKSFGGNHYYSTRSSWNINNNGNNHNSNNMQCMDKDKIILEFQNELKEKDKKIKKLEQQNHELTVRLERQNRDFVPLSGELRFSQEMKESQNVQISQPPLKKRRFA